MLGSLVVHIPLEAVYSELEAESDGAGVGRWVVAV